MEKKPYFKKIGIRIVNANVEAAGEITHYLFEMVDDRELEWVSIENAKKSKNSVEVIFGALVTFGAGYLAGKALDIPYYRAKEKIFLALQKLKKSNQTTLDVYMDDESID